MSRARVLAALALLLAAPLFAPQVPADASAPSGARFAQARAGATAVAADDGSVFLFGGYDARGPFDDAHRYDPAQDRLVRLSARLPAPRAAMAGAWADGVVLLAGGLGPSGATDEVLRFTPATGRFETLSARLPSPREGALAAWDGARLHVLGGAGAPRDVVALDPATGAVEERRDVLPRPVVRAALAPDGEGGFLVLGGCCPSAGAWRYDPATLSVEPVPDAELPSPREGAVAARTPFGVLVAGGSGPDGLAREVVLLAPGAPAAVADALLPFGVEEAAAAAVGNDLFLFGGRTGALFRDEVVRHHAGPVPSRVVARLPYAVEGAAAVSTPAGVLVFGGRDADGALLDRILRVDTGSGEVEILKGRLPTPRVHAAAFFDGAFAYVVAGRDARGPLAEVVRYDPAADVAEKLSVALPTTREGLSAVWTGREAFLVGGTGLRAPHVDEVLRYAPAEGLVTLHGVLQGAGVVGSAVAWDGSGILVAGGRICHPRPAVTYPAIPVLREDCVETEEVHRYDPAARRAQRLSVSLPSGRSGATGAWNGTAFLVVGGGGCGGPCGQVLALEEGSLRVLEPLPVPVRDAAGAWTERGLALVGGRMPEGVTDAVVLVG